MNNLISELCKTSGMKNVLVTGNGTSAIYLALLACPIPKGSYIAVPNIACPDPVYALIWAGYKPVFIDVNVDDYNINVEHFRREVKESNIRGLIAIHLFGNPCAIDVLRTICDQNGIFMVEDCAQALGNSYNGQSLGSFGDISTFSFGKGKMIEIGHGGSLQTNDDALYLRAVEFYEELPEFNKPTIDNLSNRHRRLYYWIYNLAIKYPIMDILNLVFVYRFKKYYLYKLDMNFLADIEEGLKQLESNKKKRKAKLEYYLQSLGDSIVVFPKLYSEANVLTRFTIKVNESEKVSAALRAAGIPSNTMYPPLASRFEFFPKTQKLKNSYSLKGSLLNLWVNFIENHQLDKTIEIITRKTYE
jgi:dTDP-4-amino-4,6-dideoxygalactose transaminase